MAIVDGPQKLSFLVEQAMAAVELADAIPDPAAKRFVASGVFVALDAFIALARQTRNSIPVSNRNRADLETVKRALNDLADRDWGPYSPLRDRLSAHRQPLDGSDDVSSWVAANELWAQVDAPLVGVLCADMAAIQTVLARLTGGPTFGKEALPAVAAGAIAEAPGFQPQEGVSISTGSFGETIANALSPLQGGQAGQRLREVGDTIDAYECFGELSRCLPGLLPFWRITARGAIIEATNIVELVFELPPGRAVENRFAPLVDLIPGQYPEAADLRAERTRLDEVDLQWLRSLRNTVAAHLDPRLPLAGLLQDLDSASPERLNGVFAAVCDALVSVDRRHGISVLSPLVRLRGKRLSGVERVDPGEFAAPYDEE